MSIKQIGVDRFKLDVRVKIKGKEYRHRETFLGCRRDANTRYHVLRGELVDNDQKQSSLTFKQVLDYYLERKVIDSRSIHYFDTLKRDFCNVQVSEMREKFDRYLLLLRKTKVKHTERCLSNNTINKFIAWSKAAFNCAVRGGIVEQNPLQYFQKFPTRPRDRILTEEEKTELIRVVKQEAPHIYPLILYSLQVPCRAGELHLLRPTDYNMVTNTIHIPAEMTKTKRTCIKPVPENCIEYMRNVPKDCPWLFYRYIGGKYLPIGDFRGTWKKCLKIAKIDNYRFHDQRRVAYTDLLLKGNLPHNVMQISGHATDMSRVYFGRNELLAAKAITFCDRGTLRGTHDIIDSTQVVVSGK